MERFVLDTFALMAYFRDEPGAARVRSLMEAAARGEVELSMSLINLGEFLYITERRQGENRARQTLALVDSLPVWIAEATRKRVLAAVYLKAHYPISYADAFAAALCKELRATLLTGDPEFKALEGRIAIEWVREM